ncbi:hypothetical protein BDN67DRAFT_984038 [Paxillus ammoniavirescens]|nr:hypothetical protein BDN67DRAFT_984038 [Paxillus ammoniavirescens]
MPFKPLIVTTKQKEVAISTCNCHATGSLDLNDYDPKQQYRVLDFPQSGLSHLEVSHRIETDLDEVFDRMLEAQQPQSKYEGLAQHWMDVIVVQKVAIDTLAFAQQEITNVENELSPIIGPELVQYYHRAYCEFRGGLQGVGTAIGLGITEAGRPRAVNILLNHHVLQLLW